MSTSLSPAQQDALKKLQSFQQQKALDDYLSSRATQYGTTPGGGRGWTADDALANPFAGLTKDFGKKMVAVNASGDDAPGADVEQAKTASDLFREKFGEQLGHKTTFTKAYDTTKKDNKGNPVEVDLDSLTPEELNSGKYAIHMGGATGGTKRERMAQMYIPKGDKLIPVGDPTYYKGEHPDAKNVANALKFASIATLPFGGIGGLLSGASSTLAGGLSFLPQAVANVGANAITSGILSGGISKLTGGDFSKGFKSGAISGAVGSGLDQFAPDVFKNMGQFSAPAKSIATSGITSLLTGQKFDPTTAVKNAAINYGLNQAGQSMGVDPKQQAAMMKFLNFAAPMIATQKRKP